MVKIKFNKAVISRRLRSIYGIWYRQLLLLYRNPVRLFTTFFLPFLIFIVFGTGFKLVMSKSALGFDFSVFLFPGLMAASAAVMALDSTMSIVWDREFGFLKEILVAPVSRVDVAIGQMAGATTRALTQSLTLIMIAPFIGIPLSVTRIAAVFLTITVFSWGISGLGIVIASRIKRLEYFTIIIQILIAPMVALSGAFFPTHNAANWIKLGSNLNPLTYGVDSLRFILLESSVKARIMDIFTTHSFLVSALVVGSFSIVMTYLSILAFKKMR